MAHLPLDGELQSDCTYDWSHVQSRLDSFQNSVVAEQVPAKKLAQAGFYFTGTADRVRCFSCRKTVENWCTGDRPLERHREVSPSCLFLSCVHRLGSNDLWSNGLAHNEEMSDLDFALRSGGVVDETTYPKAPHMCGEDARLRTFGQWPSGAPVRPGPLAAAGLYYQGEGDRVQCFCCGGMLGGWEEGDTAWQEHAKHFANCFFILGHDVGNVPLPPGAQVEDMQTEGSGSGPQAGGRPSVPMGSFQQRLESYVGVQHPVDINTLATAGFYSQGGGDRVLCFQCGGGLKNWQPDEDPWIEHAKHYPGCSFLLTEKGQDFVNQVQLEEPRRNAAASSQNGSSKQWNEGLKSAMAQQALAMGLDPITVERTIQEKRDRTGSDYLSVQELVTDCLNSSPQSDATSKEEDPIVKLQRLQREKQCKICMDRDICIVLVPCGHLVCCMECSKSLNNCPICCGSIAQKVKTYIA